MYVVYCTSQSDIRVVRIFKIAKIFTLLQISMFYIAFRFRALAFKFRALAFKFRAFSIFVFPFFNKIMGL